MVNIVSENKPIESVKINFDDIENFAARNTGNPPSKITNWLGVSSQVNVNGLKAFREALNSLSTPDSAEGLRELKDKHLKGLLQDLEKISKREEISSREGGNFPKFDPKFYDEVGKSARDRSPEFREFLTKYSELTADHHCVEKISAQMLIDAVKPGANIADLRKDLKDQLDDYKQKYATQTAKDIGTRELILLKDQTGQTKALTMEELASAKDLTGEQRDFIKSTWQQGSFGAGWFTASTYQHDQVKGKMTNFTQNSLLIDLSTEGKVQVINQASSIWKSDTDPNKTLGPCATATLSVDITDLKGSEFVPGCASAKPKIEAIVSKYDKDFDFIPKELVKTSSHKFDSVTEQVSADFKKGQYNTAKSDDKKLAGMGMLKFSADDPMRYRIEVEKFQSKEKDPAKVEEFATNQVDKFSQQQKAILDTAEKDRIKAGLITILEPLCKSDQEKKALHDNAGKLVRDCASKAGKDMSWGQAWSSFADKAKSLIPKLLGRQTQVEKLIEKHPDIVSRLKKNMSPPGSEERNPPKSNDRSKREIGR